MARIGSNERPGASLALVVGAGGMGMAIARRLGERHRLLLADRDEAHLAAMATRLREEGHDVDSVICDVTRPADIASMAGAIAGSGPLRAVAHVVGLSPSMGDFRSIMSVDLIGATRVADMIPALASPGLAAVFIGSLAGQRQNPADHVVRLLDQPVAAGFLDDLEAALGEDATPTLAYQLSKFALMRMCARKAAEWGRLGARIVSLSPGLIASPMGALEFERQPVKHALLAKALLAREGTMIEVADGVDFLLSDRASYITGTDLLIDGGVAAALEHG